MRHKLFDDDGFHGRGAVLAVGPHAATRWVCWTHEQKWLEPPVPYRPVDALDKGRSGSAGASQTVNPIQDREACQRLGGVSGGGRIEVVGESFFQFLARHAVLAPAHSLERRGYE